TRQLAPPIAPSHILTRSSPHPGPPPPPPAARPRPRPPARAPDGPAVCDRSAVAYLLCQATARRSRRALAGLAVLAGQVSLRNACQAWGQGLRRPLTR